MAATLDGRAITSGQSYTFNGGMAAGDFKKLAYHSVSISGSGSATVTVGFPTGSKAAGTGSIAVAGSQVYYYPGVENVIVTAVSDDIVVDFYSYEGNI